MENVNTARLNEITQIESLNEAQKASVLKLRKMAAAQRVSPHTLGVLNTRNHDALSRLTDGKRLALLSPASRELLIAEVRECTAPYDPTVVSVWSFWAERNDVRVEPEVVPIADPRGPHEEGCILDPMHTGQCASQAELQKEMDLDNAVKVPGKPKLKRVMGLQKRAEKILRENLTPQPVNCRALKEHYPEINETAWQKALRAVGAKVDISYATGPGNKGRVSHWSLPEGATPAPVKPVRREPGRKGAAVDWLKSRLTIMGEQSLAELKRDYPGEKSSLYGAARSLGVVVRKAKAPKGNWPVSFWSLPSVAAVKFNPSPSVKFIQPTHPPLAGKSERMAAAMERKAKEIRGSLVEQEPEEELVTRRPYTPPHLREAQERALLRMARRYRVTVYPLADWTEMKSSTDRGALKNLPNRESDEGIQLADYIFRHCMPVSPRTVARRITK